jgi:hypothetical protein
LARNGRDPKYQIVSYRLRADEPIHSFGTVGYSTLLDWNMNHAELCVPEQIELADATIFVAGTEGTFWARNWASLPGNLSSEFRASVGPVKRFMFKN